MERAESGDSFATPLMLASGAKPEAVEAVRRRDGIDTWLASAVGQDAEAEEALVSWLQG